MVQERDPDIDTRTCMLSLSSAGLSLIYVHRIMLEKPLYYIDSRYERLGCSNSVPLLTLYIVRLAKSSPPYQLLDSTSNPSLTKTSILTFGYVHFKTSQGHGCAKTSCRIWEAKHQ